jgi:hypothetical protein
LNALGKAEFRPHPSRLRRHVAKTRQAIFLQNLSHTTRLNCAKAARPTLAALVVLCIAGCQSNAERDLVARDRRMQEDQMWAMQDYIQQYQQLVCRFRSENASLRRQLNEEHASVPAEREPQPMPRTQPNRPATKNGPQFDNSRSPSIEQRPAPNPNIEMPDVPPLKQGTSIDDGHTHKSFAIDENGPPNQDRYAQTASYVSPAFGEAASAAGQPADDARPTNGATDIARTSSEASPDILLSGEVVANDNGGGPRLVIDIETLEHSGHIARFNGNISLALLSSDGDVQHKLARWDFGPDEVRSAVDTTASEPTMRFHIELPADTKVDAATQLWARLAPTSGGKLLSHAKLDLTKPGVFSSRTDKIWASEESVIAASYEETPSKVAEIAPVMNEGAWATAKPGKPAILPPETEQTSGGWKAASGPIPAVVANTMPPAPTRSDPPKQTESSPAQVAPAETAPKPSWSPERQGKSSLVARPSWSATR